MNISDFQDRLPQSLRVTSYDERHLTTYLRLLDADAEGADWSEVVMLLFGLDPTREPDRAKIVHESHLARARWMVQIGYRHLLRTRLQ